MSKVVRLHAPDQVDTLWEAYAALARAAAASPALMADRNHIEAMTRAMRRFQSAFNASEALR